jgi:flagellar basal body-associated protein FliL
MIDFLFHNMVIIVLIMIAGLVVDSLTIRIFSSNDTTEEVNNENETEETTKVLFSSEELKINTKSEDDLSFKVESEIEVSKISDDLKIDLWFEENEIETKKEENKEGREFEKQTIRELRGYIRENKLQKEVKEITRKSVSECKKVELVEALKQLNRGKVEVCI